MKFWDYNNIDKDKIGNISQVAGLRHYEFVDGKAKGVEAVEVHTGAGLEFTVLPGRGMDIAWTSYRGLPINYMSKTGIVSPAYYESEGMEWLHSFFAGTLTTCGLLNVGGPVRVTHPVIGERNYGLHGRITNGAAEQVSLYEAWEDGEYVMRVSGLVREGTLHGEHLSLRREISTKLGSKEFRIKDVVTNHAAVPQDMMLLYHINVGYPVLDAHSRMLANSKDITAQSEEARQEIAQAQSYSEPVLGIAERCYAHDLNTDTNGLVKVALVNDALEIGVALEYKKEALPYFNHWKMLNKKEYVVGLEPGNCLPTGYVYAKERGMLDVLQPDESKTFEIVYKILDSKEEIDQYEKEIKNARA